MIGPRQHFCNRPGNISTMQRPVSGASQECIPWLTKEVGLLGGVEIVMSRNWGVHVDCLLLAVPHEPNWRCTFAVIAVGLAIVVIAAISNIFHFTIAVFRASGAEITVSVTSVVVALTTVVFPRRIIASAATGGRGSSSTAGRALTAAT